MPAERRVDFLVTAGLLPLVSIIIEPGKVLFLNNAINHGVLTPLGVQQVRSTRARASSSCSRRTPAPVSACCSRSPSSDSAWLARARPAPSSSSSSAESTRSTSRTCCQAVLIIALIAGGMTGVATNVLFDSGLRAPASPGSIFAILLQTASDSYVGVILSVILSAAVTFIVASIILRASRKRDLAAGNAGDLAPPSPRPRPTRARPAACCQDLTRDERSSGGHRTRSRAAAVATATARPNIVFACDAGMGSSAMGASVLRNKIKKAGIEGVTVVNKAIANLDDSADLVITQQRADRPRAGRRRRPRSTSRSTTS